MIHGRLLTFACLAFPHLLFCVCPVCVLPLSMAAPTIVPAPNAPAPIFSAPTAFPTFAANFWEATGTPIPLNRDDMTKSAPAALALSFDGRLLVALHGTSLQAYEWRSFDWRPRGSALETTLNRINNGNPPGVALSAAGTVVAWGDPPTNTVHVFEWKNNQWQPRPRISIGSTATSAMSNDFYTFSLSADASVLAIGEPFAQMDAGRAHLYRWDENQQTWSNIRTWTGSVGSRTGSAISLSLDGKTVAVAAVENSLATLVPGMVRVYQRSLTEANEVWSQVGQTLVGARDGDRFGTALALSGSGQHLAVGAPAYEPQIDGKSIQNAGQIRVYKWNDAIGLWQDHGQGLEGTSAEQGLGKFVSLSNNGLTVVAGSILGLIRIHRLNDVGRWISWGLPGTFAPSSVSSAALSGNGRVLALSDTLDESIHVYQAVSW